MNLVIKGGRREDHLAFFVRLRTFFRTGSFLMSLKDFTDISLCVLATLQVVALLFDVMALFICHVLQESPVQGGKWGVTYIWNVPIPVLQLSLIF